MALVAVTPATTSMALVADTVGALVLPITSGASAGLPMRLVLALITGIGASCYKIGETCAKRQRISEQTVQNTNQINELHAETAALQEFLQQLQVQGKEFSSTVEEVRRQAQQSECRLEDQLVHVQNHASTTDQELQSARKRTRKLHAQVVLVQQRVDTTDEQLQSDRREFLDRTDAATNTVQDLQTRFARVSDEMRGLCEDVQGQRAHVEQTSSAVRGVKRRLEQVQEEVGGLRDSGELVREQTHMTRQDLQNLHDHVGVTTGGVDCLRDDVNNLAVGMGMQIRDSFNSMVDNVNHALGARCLGRGPHVAAPRMRFGTQLQIASQQAIPALD